MQEVIRSIEKTYSAYELVRNRSEKEKKQAEILSSILDRLKIIETDLSRVSAEEGLDKAAGAVSEINSDDFCNLLKLQLFS